jgi:hypothetical protein
MQQLVDRTNDALAEAITEGWDAVTGGLGEVDTKMLGISGAEQRRYFIEEAAVAGIYRRLMMDEDPALPWTRIEVAIAVLKSSWTSNTNARSPSR